MVVGNENSKPEFCPEEHQRSGKRSDITLLQLIGTMEL